MTAATGRVFGIQPYGGEAALPHKYRYPLATSVAPFKNWLMGLNSSGYAVAMASAVPNLVSLGFSDDDQEAGAANGVASVMGRQQFVSGFVNSAEANDAFAAGDLAVPAFAVDNQTVGKKSTGTAGIRSFVGLAMGLDEDNGNTPIIYPGPIGWLLARAAHVLDAIAGAEYQIADGSAAATTAERAIPRKKVKGLVTAIEFVGAAVTADNTNNATVTISKRDGAGGGATVLGTLSTDPDDEGAITAFVPKAFTLSAVAGALDLLETDVLTVTVAKGGSGQTLTGAIRVIQKVG